MKLKKFSKLMAYVLPFFMSTSAWAELTTTLIGNQTFYQIGSADDLYEFADKANADVTINGILTADITVNQNVLGRMGKLNEDNASSFKEWNPWLLYSGVFDGNKHTISGLYGTASYEAVMGFVGFNYGTIKNLGIIDSYFSGSDDIGSFASVNNGTIINCYSTASVVAETENHGGGISGVNSGKIENCFCNGYVSGSNHGGISGSVKLGATIKNCFYNGNHTGFYSTPDRECAVSSSDFYSGRVAYLLSQADNVWSQKLGTDDYPVFNSTPVYHWFCGCVGDIYTNDASMSGKSYTNHLIESSNYKCKVCGDYTEAKQVNGYYQIGTPGELLWFATHVNDGSLMDAKAVLTADIAIDNHVYYTNSVGGRGVNPSEYWVTWKPIGEDEILPFRGSFNGQGHTVSGMYCHASKYAGLFGACRGAHISNVKIADNEIYSEQYAGGVCAYLISGEISNCSNSNFISSGLASGGICGHNGGTITGCSNSGEVHGYVNNGESKFVGGICGENGSSILNCFNTGKVKGDTAVGGVCGYNMANASISRCYNEGQVSGDINVAGVCGDNGASISLCYNKGDVSATYNAGGVAGGNVNGTVNNCYGLGKVSGTTKIGGVCGENGYDDTHKGAVSNSFSMANVSYVVNGGTTSGSSVVGYGSHGSVTNCYSPRKAAGMGALYETSCTKVMRDSFAFGTVAYLLQKDQPEVVWGQEMGVDSVPVFSSDTVYKAVCNGGFFYTNNKSLAGVTKGHRYVNGVCEICKSYTEPEMVNGVYQIKNAGDLYWFANAANAGNTAINGALVNDIEVNANVLNNGALNVADTASFIKWSPICGSNEYIGTFNGNNHSISGLYYNHYKSGYNNVGLFGQSNGSIKNLTVKDSYFAGWDYVGAIAGSNIGTIDSCVNASCVIGAEEVGGVCGISGYDAQGFVKNCHNEGYVYSFTPSLGVGGVVGRNGSGRYNSQIEKCFNLGVVETAGGTLGGICGYNQDVVSNCYNIGAIVCKRQAKFSTIGGICGSGNAGVIKNCFASNDYDIIGEPEKMSHICPAKNTVINCYYNSTLYNFTDNVDGVKGLPIDSFHAGEVAYFLQEGSEQAWGQEIGVNPIPVFGGMKVYRIETPSTITYSNHPFVNGFCTKCGKYQEPEFVNGAYHIDNAGELYWFAALVNDSNMTAANAVLTANITVNSNVLNEDGWLNTAADTAKFMKWLPMAPSADEEKIYTGNFDGQKHVIRGLFCRAQRAGLFAINSGKIQNLGVEDSYFESTIQCGAVCAINKNNGLVSNCYSASDISFSTKSSSAGRIGCVCGFNEAATVDHCYGVGRVSTLPRLYGGVVGLTNDGGVVTACFYDSTRMANMKSIEGVAGKPTNSFKSGEVAYLLQNNEIWGQKIGTDAAPAFGADKVYLYFSCGGDSLFTNDEALSGKMQEHDFSEKVLSETPNADGTYSYVCAHNHSHIGGHVIKAYNGTDNLELNVDEEGNYYVEGLDIDDSKSFNTPVDFMVQELNYTRQLSKSAVVSFILPFSTESANINGVAYKLGGLENGKLIYNHVEADGVIEANTPYLLKVENTGAKLFNDDAVLSDVVIKATNPTAVTSGVVSHFGKFSKETFSPDATYEYYGYSDGKFRHYTAAMTVSAFRTGLSYMKSTPSVGAGKPAYVPAEMDVFFDDEDVVDSATGLLLNVAERGITGNVNVYDVLGHTVRVNVEAETCLEGLNNGVYVVNGKKYIVRNK